MIGMDTVTAINQNGDNSLHETGDSWGSCSVTAINQNVSHTAGGNSRIADLGAQFRAWEDSRNRWKLMIASKNKLPEFPRYFYEAKKGKCCGNCGKTFDSGEMVILGGLSFRYSSPGSDWHYQKYTLCESCKGDKYKYGRIIYSCRACGREVNGHSEDFMHSQPHCSEKCYWTIANREARNLQLLLRPKATCSVCSTKFTPNRTDSRYCSSKCRQKAYRQRNNNRETFSINPE